MMSIKIIHLAKDNQLDDMQCADCHAHLRHAIEINGITYGMDCGAKRLGWPTSKAKVARKVSQIEHDVEYFKLCFEKAPNHWHTPIQAGQICVLLGLDISKFDPNFAQKVYDAVK